MAAPLIGMHFLSFLILLILSAFTAAVLQWVCHYGMLSGVDGFLAKWIAGWLGAWLGPAVLGHWFGPIMLWNIYIIPALIGAFAGGFGIAACCRVSAQIFSHKEASGGPEHSAGA